VISAWSPLSSLRFAQKGLPSRRGDIAPGEVLFELMSQSSPAPAAAASLFIERRFLARARGGADEAFDHDDLVTAISSRRPPTIRQQCFMHASSMPAIGGFRFIAKLRAREYQSTLRKISNEAVMRSKLPLVMPFGEIMQPMSIFFGEIVQFNGHCSDLFYF